MRKARLGTILLMLWGLILTASVYTYLQWLQPSRLATTVSSLLEDTFDVKCRFGHVSLSFFPIPTVSVDDLALRRGSIDHMELHVRKARVTASWASLFSFKPLIHSVSLDSPTLDISSNILRGRQPSSDTGEASKDFTALSLPHHILGVRINVSNGTFRLASGDGRDGLSLSGLDMRSRLPGMIPGELHVDIERIRYLLASGIDLSAKDTHLALTSLYQDFAGEWEGKVQFSTDIQLGSLDTVMGRRISDPYRYFPMPEPLRLSFLADFRFDPEENAASSRGTTGFTATLPMNGHHVPISVQVPFHFEDSPEHIEIMGADVRMEDDSATLYGDLSGLPSGRPVLYGRADIHHFSLTRWFGFGRMMDVGLQDALDDITATFDDMDLSLTGVVVRDLKARVKDIDLRGSGSCREYLAPEILIDAHASYADLNRVFPELRGTFPDMSHLPPPVLPMSTAPSPEVAQADGNASPGITVGYDIHISADKADIMNFNVGALDVHVVPAPGHGTMLDIKIDDLYNGKAASQVYIRDKIRIVADASAVDLEGPSTALAGYPAITGKMNRVLADIAFAPGTGLHMLYTLGGSIKADMTNGKVTAKGASPLSYRRFKVDASAKACQAEPDKMPSTIGYRGRWDVAFDTGKWSAHAALPDAMLAFSTNYWLPCAMKGEALALQLDFAPKSLPHLAAPLKLDVEGKGGFNIAKETVDLSRARITNDLLTYEGDAKFSDIFHSPAVSGRTEASTTSLRSLLSLFGVELPSVPGKTTFGPSIFKTAFKLSSSGFECREISGRVDALEFSGHVAQVFNGRKKLTGSLASPLLDINDYLSDSKEKSADDAPHPLPLEILQDCDADIRLSLDRLRLYATTFSDVSLPIRMEGGTLSIPSTASFPGSGKLSANLLASSKKGSASAQISLFANARDVDMLALSKARQQKTLIEGSASADLALKSSSRYWDDWKSKLNGSLALLVRNGALVSPVTRLAPDSEKAVPGISRTTFKTLSMSATITDSIIRSKDFRIEDSMLKVAGEGTVDLGKQNIDARATITLAGIPELPLTIKGNIFAPETNYELIGAVTGTVGNIGATVFDVVGNILTAPLKLIIGKRPLVAQ